MKLSEQLEVLSNIGLSLSEGVSIDDLLLSFDESDFEDPPFDLLLYVLGMEVEDEVDGRAICACAWNLDMECIFADGDYAHIAKSLCRMTEDPEYLKNVEDKVDLDNEIAELSYLVGSGKRIQSAVVDEAWADPAVIAQILADIVRDGKHFYKKDNGQAMTLYYLDDDAAKTLANLSKNAITLLV